MPLPYSVGVNSNDLTPSLKKISKMGLENVVPGHGDIVLRGEIDGSIKDNQAYLSAIRKVVRKSSRRKYPLDMLNEVGVEECGKSRVLIGGLASELHRHNLKALYFQLYGEIPKANPGDDDEAYWDDDEED